jgi:hypothetical protein
MKINLEQFNKLVSEVITAKQKVEEIQKGLQQEDIDKIQKQVLQPVLQETIASPIQKCVKSIESGITTNLRNKVRTLKAAQQGVPQQVVTTHQSEFEEQTERAPELRKPISLDCAEGTREKLDPDKGLDIELLEYYKLLKPSEILQDEDPRELITAYVKNIDTNLKRWGRQISRIQDKEADQWMLLRRKIDSMRVYKYRIQDILKVLPLGRSAAKLLRTECTKKLECRRHELRESRSAEGVTEGSRTEGARRQQYKYYKAPDELINRLELLCAEMDIGNDSIEVRNEIMTLLDCLLQEKVINTKEYKELFSKWCS